MLPTAERLAPSRTTFVPDLPGFGRSQRPPHTLDIPELADALIRFLDAVDVDSATFIGNSMGCPVICEVAHRHPDRIKRAVLVSPAGGLHNRPFHKAVGQLARDGIFEPPSMARVAVPDYLRFGPIPTMRLFHAMTHYPTIERFLEFNVPSLAIIGSHDPLIPGRPRVQEMAALTADHLDLAVIVGAAHAINFSHPIELAHAIDSWLEGRPLREGAAPEIAARIVSVTSR